MVGDSPNNNSMQFRDFPAQGPDVLSHPSGGFYMVKIEPATFQGFYPVSINKDPNVPFLSQDLTIVSYGPTSSNTSNPGQAYESQLRCANSSSQTRFTVEKNLMSAYEMQQ
jgi:hypothetical protein